MVDSKMLSQIKALATSKKDKIATAKGTLEEINRSLEEKIEEVNTKFGINVGTKEDVDLSKIDKVIDEKLEEVEDLYKKSTEITSKWED